jgi:hypothetical protein
MFKKKILICILFSKIFILGQEVVSSQGGSYFSSSVVVDFTVGEIVINTVTGNSLVLTHGFHQPNLNLTEIEEHVPNFDAIVYPNPSSNLLTISTKDFNNVNYKLYDSKGSLIVQNNLSFEKTEVQVNQLASGLYSLILIRNNARLKTFHLIKQK